MKDLLRELTAELWETFNITADAMKHATAAEICYETGRGHYLIVDTDKLNGYILLHEHHRMQILAAARVLDRRVGSIEIRLNK